VTGVREGILRKGMEKSTSGKSGKTQESLVQAIGCEDLQGGKIDATCRKKRRRLEPSGWVPSLVVDDEKRKSRDSTKRWESNIITVTHKLKENGVERFLKKDEEEKKRSGNCFCLVGKEKHR